MNGAVTFSNNNHGAVTFSNNNHSAEDHHQQGVIQESDEQETSWIEPAVIKVLGSGGISETEHSQSRSQSQFISV